MAGHSASMQVDPSPSGPGVAPEPPLRAQATPAKPASVEDIYDEHFDFVWRSARRLGAPSSALDDVVQDVFLTVHRRLVDFEGRSSVKTWLFGITMRVVRQHRRSSTRKAADALPESVADPKSRTPHDHAAQNEAVELLHRLLGELDEDKRAAFILAELEQMSAPDIAEAVGANVNTIYSRLRAARREFEAALARHRARDGWRDR